MAKTINNMEDLTAALMSTLEGMTNHLAERVYETLNHFLMEYYLQGDYYDLDTAIAMVNNNGFRHPKPERLIKMLKLIANFQGIDNARKHIVKFDDEDTKEKELDKFGWSLSDLAGMGINPVTLPGRKKIKHPILGLLRIYMYMIKNMT